MILVKLSKYGHSALFFTALLTPFSASLSATAPLPNGGTISEQDYLGDLPIVLSVSRLSQPKQEAPVATTVIDRDMILASGAQDIASLLSLVPGFQVAMIDGATRSVTSHGNSDQYSRRMQVMVDGRPIYSPTIGGVIWHALPIAIEDVERIEVVRGPNAAAYGSNAFLGVINISTRKASGMVPAEVNTTIGSLGTVNNYVGLGFHDRDHHLRIGLKREENDGFQNRIDDIRSLSLNLRGDYQLSPTSSLEYQAGYRATDLAAGFEGDPVQPPRGTDINTSFQQLIWTRLMDSGSDVRIQYFHNAENNDDSFGLTAQDLDPSIPPILPTIHLITGFDFSSHRHDLEFQHRFSPNSDTRIVWGSGLRHDAVYAPYLLNQTDKLSRAQGRMFINGEWHATPSLILHGNLMGEYLDDSGSYFSPRVAANYLFGTNSALRISASRAYRFPILSEQYAHFAAYLTANPDIEALLFYDSATDIRPEQIEAYEIGLVQQIPDYMLNLDFKLFSHHVSDAIDGVVQNFSGATSVYRFQNGGSYRVEGVEIDASYKPTRKTRFNLAYAFIDSNGQRLRAEEDAGPAFSSTDDRAPQHTLSLLMSHDFSHNIQASAWLQYQDEMVWGGDGGIVPERHRLDIRLAKDWNYAGSKLSLSLVAQNLLSNDYREFNQDTNSFERRIYGQIAIQPK